MAFTFYGPQPHCALSPLQLLSHYALRYQLMAVNGRTLPLLLFFLPASILSLFFLLSLLFLSLLSFLPPSSLSF